MMEIVVDCTATAIVVVLLLLLLFSLDDPTQYSRNSGNEHEKGDGHRRIDESDDFGKDT